MRAVTRRPTLWWWAGGLVAVLVFVLVTCVTLPGALPDLKVYRAGGSAWLRGIPLYTQDFPSWLPFTYPPVAAVLFSLLAVMPFVVAALVLTVVGLVALTVTTMFAVPERVSGRLPGPLVAVAVIAAALLVEPVRVTLTYGQVNLLLMALVALDCLLPRTRYPRGLLIGVAAAVKLTPAVFVLYFLARRQYVPAATAVGTFAGVTGLGLLLAPRDSAVYWYTTVFDPNRIGGADFATNQSLRGALSRFDLSPGLTQACWLLLSVAVLALAWQGARRAGEPVTALLVVAAAGLVVSPVSWSHHWVWIVPALVAWAVRVGRDRRQVAALLLTTAVFAVGHRYLPFGRDRELDWSWWQHLLGNSYLLAAVAFLCWAAVGQRARQPDPVPHSTS